MDHSIIKPITPAEAVKQRHENWERDLPAPVLEAINSVIVSKIPLTSNYISFSVKQDEMMKAILKRLEEGRAEYGGSEENMPWYYKATRQDVYNNNWLDFESLYRRAGWKVEYDRPGFNETYDPYWTFTKA